MALQPFDGELDEPAVQPFDGPLDGEVQTPSPLRRIADVGISALKGAIGVAEVPVGLADYATGGQAGKVAEQLGFRPKEARAMLDELYSPQQQAANQALAEAKGFLPSVQAAVENPSTIGHAVVESLPLLVPGYAGARGVQALTKAGPAVAGAVGEGLVGLGLAGEHQRQANPEGVLDARGTVAGVGSGIGTALFGAVGNKLAGRLGVGEADTAFLRPSIGVDDAAAAAARPPKGFLRRMGEGAAVEGVFEEMPQSMQEQAWQNFGEGKPIGEGVAEAGAIGMLAGAAMGAGFGAFKRPDASAAPAPAPSASGSAPTAPMPPAPGPQAPGAAGTSSASPASPASPAPAASTAAPPPVTGPLTAAANTQPAQPSAPAMGGARRFIADEAQRQGVNPLIPLVISSIETAGKFDPQAADGKTSRAGLFSFLQATRNNYPEVSPADWAKPDVQARLGVDNIRGTVDNLRIMLGTEPTLGQAYMGHLLGAYGAGTLLRSDPNQPVDKAVSVYAPRNAKRIVDTHGLAGLTVGQAVSKFEALAQTHQQRLEAEANAQPLQDKQLASRLAQQRQADTGMPHEVIEHPRAAGMFAVVPSLAEPTKAVAPKDDAPAPVQIDPRLKPLPPDAKLDPADNPEAGAPVQMQPGATQLSAPAPTVSKPGQETAAPATIAGTAAAADRFAPVPDDEARARLQAAGFELVPTGEKGMFDAASGQQVNKPTFRLRHPGDGQWSMQSDNVTFPMSRDVLERHEQSAAQAAAGQRHPTTRLPGASTPAPTNALAPDVPPPSIRTPVDAGAHQAASSPLNDRAAPTRGQALAGNYKLGPFKIGPLRGKIENTDGSIRTDRHNVPPQFATLMQGYHYGFVSGTEGADSTPDKRQGVDVFVKAGTPEDYDGPVFVIDQLNPKTGKFDEHKAMIGPADEAEAQAAYLRHYEPGWKGLGAVLTMPSVTAFNQWVKSGKKSEAAVLGAQSLAAPTAIAAPSTAIAAPAAPEGAKRGTVGMKLGSGETVLTATGRPTTPFPKLPNLSTNLGVARATKLADDWLMQNAVDEAKARGDDFAARQFIAAAPKPQQADKDAAEDYLFGERPSAAPAPAQVTANTPAAVAPAPAPGRTGPVIRAEIDKLEADAARAAELRLRIEFKPKDDADWKRMKRAPGSQGKIVNRRHELIDDELAKRQEQSDALHDELMHAGLSPDPAAQAKPEAYEWPGKRKLPESVLTMWAIEHVGGEKQFRRLLNFQLRAYAQEGFPITGSEVPPFIDAVAGELLALPGEGGRPPRDWRHPQFKPLERLADTSIEDFPHKLKVFPAPKALAKPDESEQLTLDEARARMEQWKNIARTIGEREDNADKVVLSLYDESGIISQPWVDAGYTVLRYDLFRGDNLLAFFPVHEILEVLQSGKKIVGVIGQPPCTSFTNSGRWAWGAQHDRPSQRMVEKAYGSWAAQYFDKPVEVGKFLVMAYEHVVELTNPEWYYMENPGPQGRIEDITGLPPPAMVVHPRNFGDPYTKSTALWGEFNTELPTANVSARREDGGEGTKIWHLRGDSVMGKVERSRTAEGMAYALFMANHPGAMAMLDQDLPKASGVLTKTIHELQKLLGHKDLWLGDVVNQDTGEVLSFKLAPALGGRKRAGTEFMVQLYSGDQLDSSDPAPGIDSGMPLNELTSEIRRVMAEGGEPVQWQHLGERIAQELAAKQSAAESLGKSGPEPSDAGKRARARAWAENPFKAFLGRWGIRWVNGERNEYTLPLAERRKAGMVQGYPPIFRANGQPLDMLAEKAVEEGFLLEEDPKALAELIDKVLTRGERVAPLNELDDDAQADLERRRQDYEDAQQAAADPELPDDVVDELIDNDADIAWDQPGNADTVTFLRALGATDEEIQDEIARQAARSQEGDHGARGAEQGGTGPAPENPVAGAGQSQAGQQDAAPAGAGVGPAQGAGQLQPAPDQEVAPTEADALRIGLGDFVPQADKLTAMPGGSWLLLDQRRHSYENAAYSVVFSWGDGKWSATDTLRTPQEAFQQALTRWTSRGNTAADFKPADRNKFDVGVQPDLLTSPTPQDVLNAQGRANNADALDDKAQIDREAAGQTLTRPSAPEQRKDTTGDLLGGLSPEDVQRSTTQLTELRRQLVDLENRIVGAAGLAPDFIEDAMRSRKVSKAMKEQREALLAQVRELAKQLGDKAPKAPTTPAGPDLFSAPADSPAGKSTVSSESPAGKPADLPAAANTDDAGAELTYNKRNRIKTGLKWDDLAKMDPALRVREAKKDKVYPRPDYQALVDGGMQPLVAHIVKQAYDAIANEPQIGRGAPSDEQLQLYIKAVNHYMDGVLAWANNDAAVKEWLVRIGNRANSFIGAVRGQTTALSSLMPASAGGQTTQLNLLQTVYGEKWRDFQDEVRIIGGKSLTALQPDTDNAVKALKDIEKGWPGKVEAWQKRGFQILDGNEFKADYYVGKRYGKEEPYVYAHIVLPQKHRTLTIVSKHFDGLDSAEGEPKAWAEGQLADMKGKRVLLDKRNKFHGAFDSEEGAREKARELTRREGGGSVISDKGISVEAAEREGAERRPQGKNVSSDLLMETFGFKGVNFGNWMKGKANEAERQLHLNHAYDSFMDLADLLGVPPRAVSLNGMLGLAIGAQGNGQNAAHFVPGVNEINLTRTAGAGSLAHEWGHGLDHYFARLAGLERDAEPFLTEHVHLPLTVTRMELVDGKRVPRETQRLGSGLRPEIGAAFKAIVEAMNKRPLTEGELKLQTASSLDRARKNVAGWLDAVHRDFDTIRDAGKKAAALQQLDTLTARIKAEDYGDGYVGDFFPVVAELRQAFKQATGRVYSLDNAKGLQSNLQHLKYLLDKKDASDSHVPQLTGSDYARKAAKLDKDKGGKKYWSTNLEKFARAFDAFVSDTLAARAAKNTYLSHAGRSGDTVPEGEERQRINAGFASLIAQLKTEATEGGNIALREPEPQYSVGGGTPYETDLFGNPLAAPAGARPGRARVRRNVQPAAAVSPAAGDTVQPLQEAGEFYVETLVATAQERTLGAARVTTPAELAQATAYLYRSAVERFDAIVTDKDGKPLAVVGSFKGALSQTSVYPATVVAEAIRVPGAAHIWFSHNHPSGLSTLSRADRNLAHTLYEAFRGSGVEPMGIMAVSKASFSFAPGRQAAIFEDNEPGSLKDQPIPAADAGVKVPVYERELRDDRVAPVTISSPDAAKRVAKDFYARAKGPGILMLDSQNSVSAWVPLPPHLRGELRGTGGLGALYRAVSRSNAGNAIIVHDGELGGSLVSSTGARYMPVGNVANALRLVDVRVLDVVHASSPLSAAETGSEPSGGPVFKQGEAGAGTSAPALQKLLSAIAGTWVNAPRVKVLPSIEAAPQELRDEARQRVERGGNPPKGALFDGVVYVFADVLDGPLDGVQVLLHESFGHIGLAGAFGDELRGILKQVATMRRADIDGMLRKNGMANTEAARLEAAEELLAEMAERNPQMGFVRRAIAAIRNWLRQHVPLLGRNMKLSDADIVQGFILPARRWMQTGQAAPRTGLRFSAGSEATQPFYSALTREMEKLRGDKPQAKSLPVVGWQGAINSLVNAGKVKDAEVQWSGLREWLALQQGKVSADAVLDFLRDNGVQVHDVLKNDGAATSALDDARVRLDALGYDLNQQGARVIVTRRSDGIQFLYDEDLEAFSTPYIAAEDAEPLPADAERWAQVAWRVVNDEVDDDAAADLEADSRARYGRFQMPGGERYREVLLTLPRLPGNAPRKLMPGWSISQVREGYWRVEYQDETLASGRTEQEAIDRAHQFAIAAFGRLPGDFHYGHWNEANVLAHIRLNERTDSDGRRVLFVEEMQSDWARLGRKHGFKQPAEVLAGLEQDARDKRAAFEAAAKRLEPFMRGKFTAHPSGALTATHFYDMAIQAHGIIAPSSAWFDHAQLPAIRAAVPRELLDSAVAAHRDSQLAAGKLHDAKQGRVNFITPAPFVGSAEGWLQLAMKRVIKMAVDEGFDRVAFIGGQQSADRYSLRKQIDVLEYSREGGWLLGIRENGDGPRDLVIQKDGITPELLPDYVGKELAERLLQGEEKALGGGWGHRPYQHRGVRLSGVDLELGGEKHFKLYDKMVPQMLGKMLPKLGGGKLEQVWLNGPPGLSNDSRAHAMAIGAEPALGFTVTPAMRKSAGGPLPLFSQSQRAQPGANIERLAGLLGPQLYGNMRDMGPVTVKELFQNSFDALKGLIEAGTAQDPEIAIGVSRDDRTITIHDNGAGMTPEIINKAFLTIAGTNKDTTRSSGGFGIAKMLFLFGNERLQLTTVRDGVRSTLDTSGQALMRSFNDPSAAPEIVTDRTDEPSGTTITVTVPREWRNPSNGEKEGIGFPSEYEVKRLLATSPLFEPIRVTVNGSELDIGSGFRSDDFTTFATVKFDWGTARIVVSKREEPKGQYDDNVHMLSNGLWQFSERLSENPLSPDSKTVPRTFYFNIEPRVKPEEPGYPFALNRQGLTPMANKDVSRIKNYLSVLYQGSRAAEDVAGFGQVQYVSAAGKLSEPITLAPKFDDEVRKNMLTINEGDQIEVKDGRLVVNGREVPELTSKDLAAAKIDAAKFKIDQGDVDPSQAMIHDNLDVIVPSAARREHERLEARVKELRRLKNAAWDRYSDIEYEARHGRATEQDAENLKREHDLLDEDYWRAREKADAAADALEAEPAAPRVPITKFMRDEHFGERFDAYLGELGNFFMALRDAVAREGGDKYDGLLALPVGTSFDTQYYGVHIRVPFRAMFLNPSITAVDDRNEPGDTSLRHAALSMVGTMVHEIAHYPHMDHSERFIGEMQRLYVVLQASERFDLGAFHKAMQATLEKYRDIYVTLNELVRKDGAVVNRGIQLSDAGNYQRREGVADDVAGAGQAGRDNGPVAGQAGGRAGAAAASDGPDGLRAFAAASRNLDRIRFSQSGGPTRADTEAFRKWFAGSRVTDLDGRPRVQYHGTHADFNAFSKDWLGRRPTGTNHRASSYLGFFFAQAPDLPNEFATEQGGNLMPVYLSIKHPYMMTAIEADALLTKEDALALRAKLQRAGHDGIRIPRGGIWVAFEPDQIKSAVGNIGTFEPGNPDIRFSQSNAGRALKAVTVADLTHRAGNKWTDYRNLFLGSLGGRQLSEVYASDLPLLPAYTKLVQQMGADVNEVGAAADDLARRWAEVKDERAMADLMHDATVEQIDPTAPFVPGDGLTTYLDLKRRYDALSAAAKAIFNDVRKAYESHYAEVHKAVRERILRSSLDNVAKAKLIARMEAEFFGKIKGIYFPLARFGKYVVIAREPDGTAAAVTRAETLSEAEAARERLLAAYPLSQGFSVGKIIKDKDYNATRDAVSRGFMSELFKVLDDSGVGDELRDAINQLYLTSVPDLSWAKHGIHRKGTPGFSQDARRAFAQNMFHGARYLAKLQYADQLQDGLAMMQQHVQEHTAAPGYDNIRAQQVVDELHKRYDILMNPQGHPLSTALTSFGFVFHLGLSPASAIVNLTQTALVAYPMMGAKWGLGKAAGALTQAAAEVSGAKNDMRTALKGEELDAIERAVRAGTIDVTMAHDLAGIAQGEDQGVLWRLRPVMRAASFLFHHAERFNRQVTFLAAYRLAKQAGADAAQAYEQATDITYATHFDYSGSNRPRFMQGNVAKVILLFKQYAQNMIFTLARQAQLSLAGATPEQRAEARMALAGLLVAHASAAGVLGLPLVGTLLAAASMLGGDDDEPWDAEVALRNLLADSFGKGPAEVIARGLSRATPWDISARVGLDKLIFPDIQEGLEGARLAESAMGAALGPVAGIGVNVARGLQDIAEGRVQRGLESIMPSFLRGPIRALRFAEEGAKDRTGIVIKDPVSAAGIVGQVLGFSPSDVRSATEGRSAIYQHDKRLMERRQSLMAQYAQAVQRKDNEGILDARRAIAAFNAKNPARVIAPLHLQQSIRARARRQQQAESGVYLPPKRRDALEQGRFATGE